MKWLGIVTFTRSLEEGAMAEYLCATSDSETACSGKYYSLNESGTALKEMKASDEALDPFKASQL